jgi:hypothetical protein
MMGVSRRRFLRAAPIAACGVAFVSRDGVAPADFDGGVGPSAIGRSVSVRVPLALVSAFDGPDHQDRLRAGDPLHVLVREPFAYVMCGDLVLGCLPPRWKAHWGSLVSRGVRPEVGLGSIARSAEGRLEIEVVLM